MVNAGDKVIYLDPYAGEYTEKAHLIMISHSHSDHCDATKIQAIRQRDTIVFAPSDCSSKVGGSMKSLKPGEKAVVDDDIVVEAVPAYNHKRFRSPGVPYHPKDLGVGYILTAQGKTIYHAGDTDFIEEMNALKAWNIDLMLLPSGGTYTMDNLDAVEATLAINPTYVIPMHRWDTSPEDFKRGVGGRSRIMVILLKPGEQYTLP
jgi:L-ascorbate metabolism protein UlaG (beta-lactamase superfamily)